MAAASLLTKTLNSLKNPLSFKALLPSFTHRLTCLCTAAEASSLEDSSSFTFSSNETKNQAQDPIFIRPESKKEKTFSSNSVTMPMSFMTGSIVGKRFYKKVLTREADDGNGWTVMLDYSTLKTPCKGPLKLSSLSLAKAIAAEWEYQVDRWGLVEGGHDIDIADLEVQIASAAVFLRLSRRS